MQATMDITQVADRSRALDQTWSGPQVVAVRDVELCEYTYSNRLPSISSTFIQMLMAKGPFVP